MCLGADLRALEATTPVDAESRAPKKRIGFRARSAPTSFVTRTETRGCRAAAPAPSSHVAARTARTAFKRPKEQRSTFRRRPRSSEPELDRPHVPRISTENQPDAGRIAREPDAGGVEPKRHGAARHERHARARSPSLRRKEDLRCQVRARDIPRGRVQNTSRRRRSSCRRTVADSPSPRPRERADASRPDAPVPSRHRRFRSPTDSNMSPASKFVNQKKKGSKLANGCVARPASPDPRAAHQGHALPDDASCRFSL